MLEKKLSAIPPNEYPTLEEYEELFFEWIFVKKRNIRGVAAKRRDPEYMRRMKPIYDKMIKNSLEKI